MAVAYNKYTAAVEPLMEAINSGSDTWKVALAATVNAADTTFTPGTTDLATGNGYTQGGNTAAVSSATQAAGVYKLVLSAPATWTASGAGFTFRYVILWNSTNSIPVGYWDYGGNVVMSGANADTFTFTPDGTNGVFTVT
jgi:hypothetical protein